MPPGQHCTGRGGGIGKQGESINDEEDLDLANIGDLKLTSTRGGGRDWEQKETRTSIISDWETLELLEDDDDDNSLLHPVPPQFQQAQMLEVSHTPGQTALAQGQTGTGSVEGIATSSGSGGEWLCVDYQGHHEGGSGLGGLQLSGNVILYLSYSK